LENANLCLSKDPNFVRGYHRKALALQQLGRIDEARATISQGLLIDAKHKALLGLKIELETYEAKQTAEASNVSTLQCDKVLVLI
jgi:hypothetical protein